MPFDRIFLDELSARNDIVEIVSQYVQLKKSGANYFGLCPFTMRKPVRFRFRRTSRSFTASAAAQAAVSSPLL